MPRGDSSALHGVNPNLKKTVNNEKNNYHKPIKKI